MNDSLKQVYVSLMKVITISNMQNSKQIILYLNHEIKIVPVIIQKYIAMLWFIVHP